MFEQYPLYEHSLAKVQLLLFMLGMGATLDPRDFLEVWRRPRSLIVAATGQIIVIPLVAYAITRMMALQAGLAVGLILISTMPGGTLSKVFTFVGRGNVALSITLSATTTLAAIVTVPLSLRWLAADFIPATFEMPLGEMVRELGLFLLAPMGVGMVLGRAWPRYGPAFSRWCIRAGFVTVVILVIGSLGSGRIRPGEHGWAVPLIIILFCVFTQQLNMILFYFLPWPRADRLAAGIEVTMRNMNLALLLKPILFPAHDADLAPLGDDVLFVILFYAAVAMGAGLPLSLNHRRLSRRELAKLKTPNQPGAPTTGVPSAP